MGRILPLALALSACAGGPVTGGDELHVGVAVRDITPPDGYPMSGYYHERGATGVRDPLHAKAIVFRQGGVVAALVMTDLCGVSADLSGEARRRASERSGIPASNIAVAATHTHTGPEYYRDLREHLASPKPASYAERLVEETAKSVVDALAAAKPARLRAGKGLQEAEISFCRRFVMKDGTTKTWANFKDPNTVKAEGPVDPEVAVLLVGEPPSAALVNFALHLDTLGGTKWSADYPHDLEESLRAELGKGFVSIFANGCCGDINHVNPRSSERNKTDVIGRALAATVKSALPKLETLGRPSLGVRSGTVRVPLQEATPEELARAKAEVVRSKKGEKLPFLDEVKAYKILELDHLRNGPRDPEIGRLVQWGMSASLHGVGDRIPLEVQAIRLDADTAIVTLPGEVFVELGLAIKKGSPFKNTFVVELANVVETIYIPTQRAYPGGSYEVTNSVLKPGGGEMLVDEALRLLRDLRL